LTPEGYRAMSTNGAGAIKRRVRVVSDIGGEDVCDVVGFVRFIADLDRVSSRAWCHVPQFILSGCRATRERPSLTERVVSHCGRIQRDLNGPTIRRAVVESQMVSTLERYSPKLVVATAGRGRSTAVHLLPE